MMRSHFFMRGLGLFLLCLLGLGGCQTAVPASLPPAISLPTLAATAASAPSPTATLPPLLLPTYTPLPHGTAAPQPTPPPTATTSPAPSPTAVGPYTGLSIDELSQRTYGGGLLEIVETLQYYPTFTRYLIRYPSDGLTIYGFMNVPNDGERFPVALVLHGYVPEETYRVQTYTTRYADQLAEAGYLVIHPNYRNFPPSDTGPNLFRIGFAVDVLNLMAIVRQQSTDPLGPLRRADADKLYLWGHSMGGGIAQRVLTVWPQAVRAAVLYAPMSGDEQRNFEKIIIWSEGVTGEAELAAPPEVITAVSPQNYLGRWQTPISLHHGTADATVPFPWSETLCDQLKRQNHPTECYWYENAPHTFTGTADALFMERVITFFESQQ